MVITTEGISTEKTFQELGSIKSPTEERATKYFGVDVSPICLPKGSGALDKIHEKFEVNVVSGTANFKVPIPVTPGRPGFSPLLVCGSRSERWKHSLEIGWSLSYPIEQKRNKYLPRYREGPEEVYPLFLSLKICYLGKGL